MKTIDPQEWKQDFPAFREKTAAFYRGELKKNDYKGFSGLYGSYAQKDGEASMLRLRMTAGSVSKEKMLFIAKMIREYQVKKMHFTTCQSIQLHDLDETAVCEIMEKALDAGIVTMGGGGDFPRNIMCSPLAGVEKGEYFDVEPYAKAAGDYLMHFIKAEKMPRKLKVGFSGSPENLTHATYRDLGFAARKDGTFDVYSAGGLGNNPRFGVKVAEAVQPEEILYYIKAMWLTFRTYGNYDNRGKARTRYMQEALGGPEKYREAFLEKLKEVYASGENLKLKKTGEASAEECGGLLEENVTEKSGDGTVFSGSNVVEQKQGGLYALAWHPIGGLPSVETFCEVAAAMKEIEGAELRLAPYETAYVINLTGKEAEAIDRIIRKDTAVTRFETSVSCIGASICQVGLRDSQGLLSACVKKVKEAGIPDGALPQIHISGCPSSCGTHQTGPMGFRGASVKIDGKAEPAYLLYINGCERQGEERMGHEAGLLTEADIPEFLAALGKTVAESGMDFNTWNEKHPDGIEKIAAPYLRQNP